MQANFKVFMLSNFVSFSTNRLEDLLKIGVTTQLGHKNYKKQSNYNVISHHYL
jgi:hypothetical protein